MPRLAVRMLPLALLLAAICAAGAAQEPRLAPTLHPWGRFEPGAWNIVHVVTETLNEQGQVVSTSTTDTKTTLVHVDSDGVTLEVEACMEVAGKRFQVEPQTVKQGFHGETAVSDLKLKDPTDGQFAVEDRKIPCKIQQLEMAGPTGKTSLTLYYSTTPPYLLKRQCLVTDAEGKSTVSETNTDAIVLDMPVRVLDDLRSGNCVKKVHKNGKTTVTTLAVVVGEVPGGVVSHSSKEVDEHGRLLRRSTLALVDYNADPDKDRSSLFGRKRANRRTKPTTRYEP
jgi:hypothetical protein